MGIENKGHPRRQASKANWDHLKAIHRFRAVDEEGKGREDRRLASRRGDELLQKSWSPCIPFQKGAERLLGPEIDVWWVEDNLQAASLKENRKLTQRRKWREWVLQHLHLIQSKEYSGLRGRGSASSRAGGGPPNQSERSRTSEFKSRSTTSDAIPLQW